MRITIVLAAFALAMSAPVAAFSVEAPSYQQEMARAGAAFEAEDWTTLNQHLDAAQSIRPYSLYVWKNRILARQLNSDTQSALALAKAIADRGLSMDLSSHEELDALTAKSEFAPIAAAMKANLAPKGDDAIWILQHEADLLPEALAVDRKGAAYIGSVRTGQILMHDGSDQPQGIAFADGGIFDIEVRGNKLWAAVNNQLAYESPDSEGKFAALTQFNLKSGAPVREIRVGDGDALIGDIEVAKNGTVYASDSITPRLFKLAPGAEEAEVFASDPRFANLQGIALDETNKRLFLADYLTGLYVIDTSTEAVTKIANPDDFHLGNIDGLYIYKGDLIGIQNGTSPQRIVRISLNDDVTAAVSLTVLTQNLEEWNEPTHGAVVGDTFRYIATSNWPSYDQDWDPRQDSPPQPLRIMMMDLD